MADHHSQHLLKSSNNPDESHHHNHADSIIIISSRGTAKAQSSLHKILRTISGNQIPSITTITSSIQSSASTSSSEFINVSECDSHEMGPTKKASFDFDLNLSPPPETEQDFQPPPAPAPADSNAGLELQLEGDGSNGRTEMDPDEEISHREEKSKRIRRFEALLDVVVNNIIYPGEGASSEFMNGTELTTGTKEQGNAEEGRETAVVAAEEEEEQKLVEENEDSVTGAAAPSPVVKSKRGRVQVLPHKYRDSVVEPITSLSSRRHKRSSSSSTHVPTKRRTR